MMILKMWIHVIISILAVQYVSSQECDEDNSWYPQAGYCFRVSRSAPETQYTWREAREACLAEGGDLASIHSATEQAFIVQLAFNAGLTGFDLWMGMNSIDANTFTWSDGSQINYLFWDYGQPLTGGLTYCGYTQTESGPGDFTRHTYTTSVYGLIYYPPDADGFDIFYFGQRYDVYDVDWCESECEQNSRCAAYTWYWYHWDYYWDHVCVGRSDRYNVLTYDSYSDAGVRYLSGGQQGWWQSVNCGINKAFTCRKEPGSDTPITIPPTSLVNSYCPAGYYSPSQHDDNKCFRMIRIEDEAQGFRWDQALTLCRNGPGIDPDLASIHSAEENAFLNSQLQGYQWGFWIGYHYASSHDLWVWADNTEPVYSNWQGGTPPDGTGSQCTEMIASAPTSGVWTSNTCDKGRGFICQTFKDPANPITTPNPSTAHECETGWFPYWYGCYRVITEAKTWADASSDCIAQGAALASIHSSAENSALFWGAAGAFPMWIGLYKDTETGTYKWSDGWPNVYANFDQGGTSNGDGCVSMKSNEKWNDTLCAQIHPYICKKTSVPTPTTPEGGTGYCPRGSWIRWGSHCYWFSDTTATFADAEISCQLEGGLEHESHLVSIENALENDFIYRYMVGPAYYYNVWIGLRRNPSDIEEFVWIDGTPLSWENWAPGEPNNPYEYCGEMKVDTWPGKWNDVTCDTYDYSYYVCEADLGPEPTYPPVPTSAPGECPSIEWYQHETSCFLIRPKQYLRWHDALEICRVLTGDRGSLVSVRNQTENNFIRFWANYLLGPNGYTNIWIGFSKNGLGYPYEWEDGTQADTYTNWHPGEPNDIDGTNNCVRMYVADSMATNFGMWDDYICGSDYENGYVCRTEQGNYKDLKIPPEFAHHVNITQNRPPHLRDGIIDKDKLYDHYKNLKNDNQHGRPQHHEFPRHKIQHIRHRPRETNEKDIIEVDTIEMHDSGQSASPRSSKEIGAIVAIVLGCAALIAIVATIGVATVTTKRRKQEIATVSYNVNDNEVKVDI